MSTATLLLAHSDGAALNLWGVACVAVTVVGAAFWLVSINRRLDAQEEQTVETETQRRSPMIAYVVGGLAAIAVIAIIFAVYRAQTDLKTAQPQMVVTDLCNAATQAKTDPAAALVTFNRSPPDGLHALVTDVNAKDAEASAKLTRAKTQAEAELIAKSPDAAEFVATLADQTIKAYRIVDPNIILTGCS